MTLGERLKNLRREIGLSQEAFGAQGLISAPGWIKIENGQRHASEKLIERIAKWAVNELKEELLTLKYLGSRSPFVREMARTHAKKLPSSATLLAAEEPGAYKAKPKRGRPPGTNYKKRVAVGK